MSSKITREWKDKAKIKEELNEGLFIHTGCSIQGPDPGWPCNSCFHTIIEEDYGQELKEDVHEYWLGVLAIRGDYDDDINLELYEDHLIELNELMKD